MAKKHKNLENIKIAWNGNLDHPEAGNQGQSIPASVDIVWGSNPYTWGDVNFVIEIADGIGTGSRRAREARLQQLDKDKKKRLIHLICRVKGEKVYDDVTEVGDVKINIDDVELVVENIIGKVKLEMKSGI